MLILTVVLKHVSVYADGNVALNQLLDVLLELVDVGEDHVENGLNESLQLGKQVLVHKSKQDDRGEENDPLGDFGLHSLLHVIGQLEGVLHYDGGSMEVERNFAIQIRDLVGLVAGNVIFGYDRGIQVEGEVVGIDCDFPTRTL